MADRLSVLGVPVDALTIDDVLERLTQFVAAGPSHQVITANPLMILAARETPALWEAFHAADLVVPDSVGVQWAARIQGRRLSKISGIDLLETLCQRASERGWTVFMLGAGPGVAEAAGKELLRRYPGLRLLGTEHGFFSSAEEPELLAKVSRLRPDLLFVGLDTPRQDAWIHKNLNSLGGRVSMGVGGSFDVLSGRLHRAPAWIRAAGLEWFFRLLQEPRRAARMARLPRFALQCLLGARTKNP